ncbi:g5428 [Coccomyxa elongata]
MATPKSEHFLSQVCHPLPGPFDFDSPALKWVPGTYGKTTFKQVYILSERFSDFLRGERERGRSDFYIKTSQGRQNNCVHFGGDKENVHDNDHECSESADIKRPEKGFMHCECGPQDNRDKQPIVQAKQVASRVKRSQMGLSVRVGCPVHFRYKKLPTAPSITEIRYYAFQHLNHGTGTEANGLRSTFSRISAELKDTVTAKLLQGLEPAEIVRQNVDCFISSHMVEKGIMDRDEGRVSLEASQPPRDYFLSYADVANLKDKVDKQQWKFSENTQQSLRMFVEQNSSDILLYSEQEPIKGTADYNHMMQGRTVSQTVEAGKCSGHNEQAACPLYTDLGIEPAEVGQGSAELAWGCTQVDLNQPPAIDQDRNGQANTVKSADANFTFNADNWTLFQLAFMKTCNVDNAVHFGHGRPLIMDATFGTNREKMPLITLLVVDDHGNGVPIAWGIISQEKTEAIAAFLKAVRQRVRQEQPDWDPSCILVDACAAEIAATEMSFPSSVWPFICHWHAQAAWKKQLFHKCNREGKNRQPNVEPMFRALLDIMRYDPPNDDIATARRLAKGMVLKFLERFAEEEDFCRYFKAQWADKLDMICQILRRLKGCNINCTSHAEGYHSSLKANFLHGKRRLTARRLDWLVYILHSRFVESSQVNLHKKDVGRLRNHDAFYQVSSLLLRANKMADQRVQLLGMGAAAVPGLSKPDGAAALAAADQALEPATEAVYSAGADDIAALPGLDSAASAAIEAAAAQIGGVNIETPVDQPASTKAAAGVVQRRSGYDKAMAALSRLRSLGKDWERDSLDWDLLEHHALRAVHDVEKALAGRGAMGPTSDMARVLTNPAAPLHNSLERGKSWLEKLGQQSRKRKHDGSLVDARPEAFQLIPAPQRNVKERSVLEQIQRRTESCGGGTSAAAASAAVPRPLVSGAGILAPLCPVDPLPAVNAALEAGLGNTEPRVHTLALPAPLIERVKRATQGLQPSRFRS